MAFEKHELKLLLKELKNIFATKKELEDLDIDIDLDSIDIAYVGEEEPENNNAIWFDSGEKNKHEITYDNPVIDELFMCIRTLQDQVKKLQEDVEYLKINGGSIRPPKEDDEDDVVNVIFALEDGGLFLLEDGGYLLTEESANVPVTNSSSLTLENGGLFLLEDGGIIILEESINEITDSLLLLENGAKMLMEDNSYMILEK